MQGRTFCYKCPKPDFSLFLFLLDQYGENHLEQARVDMINDVTDDLTMGILKAYCQKNEADRVMKTFTRF